MFKGFSPRTIDFMWELRLNNNRPWFTEHKEEFHREFQLPMKELGAAVFADVKETCGDRGFIHKVSRIYKDARRVRDGEPYRDHLWFSIEKPSDEWTSTPVFWFELSPEKWSCGLGFYQAKPLTMAKFRARIDKAPKQFETLIAPLATQDDFVLTGAEYARKKQAPTTKTADWYNKKSFSLVCEKQNGAELFSPEFADVLVGRFAFLMPLYDYFITLDSDPEPEIYGKAKPTLQKDTDIS